jgi:class 3 adenylate cyclase/tetratricopeptide (TPR) repeat protein
MAALNDPKKPANLSSTRRKKRGPSIRVEPYERRMVTILFADLVGYSKIGQKYDPEYFLEVMNKAYPCLLDPVEEHGGKIIQVMGDGIMAYFGTPVSREDDPERAVLAGLDIVERVKRYAREIRRKKIMEEFRVRVGINTGLVVVGDLEPKTHLDYFAMGDAVILATRMEQNAPPNGVMVSSATYRHVRHQFEAKTLTPIKLKNREQLEQTYLIRKAKPMHQRRHRHGIEGIETPMVGRESELKMLQSNYRLALQENKNPFIIISGDAGIGKTRLMEEFAKWAAAQDDPPFIFHGHANPNTINVPYWVFRDLFAHQFDILESDSRVTAMQKFRQGMKAFLEPEKADLVGQLVGFNFNSSPTVARLLGSSSFSELASLYLLNYFRGLAKRPVLIWLEDIVWIDESSYALLSRLIEDLNQENGAGFMCVCTTRSQFLERFPEWQEKFVHASLLALHLLPQNSSRELISDILKRVKDIPEVLFDCIVKKTEGNPLFIEEIIKMLIDEGVIKADEEPWRINKEALAEVHVPPTLTGILQTRLDGLPAGEKLVVHCAAVVGHIFWDGAIDEMIGKRKNEMSLEDCLDRLQSKGLIFRRNRSTIENCHEFIFKHALMRDAAYENVLIKHRRIYHGQVAEWIERNAVDGLEEHLTQVAGHYALSNQADMAAEWYIRAGERASTQNSFKEALESFDLAMKYLQPDDLNLRWRALVGHDEAAGMLGEREKRQADDAALVNLALQTGDDSKLAKAYFQLGSQEYNEGKYSSSLKALDSALQAAERLGDPSLQALILPLKVSILSLRGDLQSADLLAESALKIAYQTEDTDIIVRALTNVGIYYLEAGNLSQSIALMLQQIDMNRQQGNQLGEAFGEINLGYTYLSVGQFEQGHELLEHSLQVTRDMGASRLEAYTLLNLGLAKWRLGRYQAACETIGLSLAILDNFSDQRGLASGKFYMGLAQENAGNFDEADEHYETARQDFMRLGAQAQSAEAQAGLARLALIRNDLVEAEKHTQKITDQLGQNGTQGLELPSLVYLSCAKVFHALGDLPQLKAILEEGRRNLNQRLEKIAEENWREMCLKGVPENYELMNFSMAVVNRGK